MPNMTNATRDYLLSPEFYRDDAERREAVILACRIIDLCGGHPGPEFVAAWAARIGKDPGLAKELVQAAVTLTALATCLTGSSSGETTP